MKNKHFALFIFVIFAALSIIPIGTSAQTYSREWRRTSSTISSRINNLDDDKVENLPVPILFGITPTNLTRNFGDPRSDGRIHEGLDIMAPLGAPIVSPTEAVVIRVGNGDSAGNYVYTANPGDETFAYMHLDEIADIDEGDELKKGDLIGYVGNTGNASGGATHLHFEIRYDHEATDPYPRLTRIFPLADKIEYLENIMNDLNDTDDEEDLARAMVALYSKELLQAQALNIPLPEVVAKELLKKTIVVASSITRTLRLGSVGDDVKLLQSTLGITADGSFGPKTEAAVKAFQASKGLVPDGVFGPISRAALLGGIATPSAGCTATTIYSPTTGIKCPVI